MWNKGASHLAVHTEHFQACQMLCTSVPVMNNAKILLTLSTRHREKCKLTGSTSK